MRLTSLARRSVAVTAVTALVSGGLAAGLATPAFAAGAVTSFTPDQWDNRSTVTLSVTGTDFPVPSAVSHDTLIFTPVTPDLAHEVGTFVVDADPGSTATHVTAKVPLAMAPTGQYSLQVADANGANATAPAAQKFVVYGFGSANATGVAFGPDPSGSSLECSTTASCLSRALPNSTPLDITGSNFAIGAKVRFLRNGVVDPDLTFVQHNPNNDANSIGTQDADGRDGTGYASSTLLQGNYTAAPDATPGVTPGFTPGLRKLQVVNNDGLTAGSTVDFAQPWFAAPGDGGSPLSPAGIGVGAQNIMVTLTGQGIRSGSALSIQSKSTSSCAGVTTGPSTVSSPDANGTFTKISAPVSMADCTTDDLTARAVTVVGPDGGRFTRNAVFNIVANPTFGALSSGYDVLGQGARVGYSPETVTITGTGFVADAADNPAKMTKFSFGDGITVTTVHVLSPGAAQVTIDVADDAATGPRVATVTNPDGGSSTKAGGTLPSGDPDPSDPAPLTITAGPKVTNVSPSSLKASASGQEITVTGTFDSADSYVVKVCDKLGTKACTESANINEGSVTDTATTLTFSISTNGATAGPRDLVVTDTTDHGRAYCTGCLAVDTLTVSPTSAPNGHDATLTFSQADGIDTVTSASTATLTRTVPLSGQGTVPLKPGTHLTPGSGTASGTFDLAGVAPGKYSVLVTKDPLADTPTTWSCTGCFTVTGAPYTVTKIDRIPTDGTPDTNTSGGQGASDLPVKIEGTNLTTGMGVSIPDVTVHDITFVSSTEIHFLADIATNAATGNKPVTVTGSDGSAPASGSSALTFTVTAAPAPAAPTSPAAFGQGAGTPLFLAANPGSTTNISISGEGFQSGAQLSLGPDIAAQDETVTQGKDPVVILGIVIQPGTPDVLTARLAISQVAAVGKRAAVITNPDGGSGTAADAFTVNPGPKITSVANENGAPVLTPDGVVHKITVLGSGFATGGDPTKVLDVIPADNVTISNVVVVDSGKITADVKVDTTAVRGPRTLGVTNDADKGFGSLSPVYVAKVPSVPGINKTVGGVRSLTVSWTKPADNGAPITTYHVVLQPKGTTLFITKDVAAPALSTTVTGLWNNVTYIVTVQAVNVAGPSAVAKTGGIPGLTTTLTAVPSVKLAVAASGVRISGKLMHGSTPVAGRVVKLTYDPAIGATFTRNVTTSSTGSYTNTYLAPYNFTVRAAFAGDNADGTYRSSTSPLATVQMAVRINRTAPANGSSSSSTSVLTISGNVYPKNKAGKIVYLYRYVGSKKTLINRATVTSANTFVFSGKPPKGTYTFRMYMPAGTGNVAGYSPAFTIHRV